MTHAERVDAIVAEEKKQYEELKTKGMEAGWDEKCCYCNSRMCDSKTEDGRWLHKECDDDGPKKWYAVEVDLDGKYFGTFVVYTTSEEEARDEIADSDIGAPDYDVITLYAYEYEGDVSDYENDKTAYYQLE